MILRISFPIVCTVTSPSQKRAGPEESTTYKLRSLYEPFCSSYLQYSFWNQYLSCVHSQGHWSFIKFQFWITLYTLVGKTDTAEIVSSSICLTCAGMQDLLHLHHWCTHCCYLLLVLHEHIVGVPPYSFYFPSPELLPRFYPRTFTLTVPLCIAESTSCILKTPSKWCMGATPITWKMISSRLLCVSYVLILLGNVSEILTVISRMPLVHATSVPSDLVCFDFSVW